LPNKALKNEYKRVVFFLQRIVWGFVLWRRQQGYTYHSDEIQIKKSTNKVDFNSMSFGWKYGDHTWLPGVGSVRTHSEAYILFCLFCVVYDDKFVGYLTNLWDI
jgi:hypothetical protein